MFVALKKPQAGVLGKLQHFSLPPSFSPLAFCSPTAFNRKKQKHSNNPRTLNTQQTRYPTCAVPVDHVARLDHKAPHDAREGNTHVAQVP